MIWGYPYRKPANEYSRTWVKNDDASISSWGMEPASHSSSVDPPWNSYRNVSPCQPRVHQFHPSLTKLWNYVEFSGRLVSDRLEAMK